MKRLTQIWSCNDQGNFETPTWPHSLQGWGWYSPTIQVGTLMAEGDLTPNGRDPRQDHSLSLSFLLRKNQGVEEQ